MICSAKTHVNYIGALLVRQVKTGVGWDEGERFCRMNAAEYQARLARGDFELSSSSTATVRKDGVVVRRSPGRSGYATPAEAHRPLRDTSRKNYEEELHMACFDWIFANERRYPDLQWIFHAPNGGHRTKAQAGRFKAMGVRAGVVDILGPFASAGAAGLACELKAPKKGPTPDQLRFLQSSHQRGYITGLCTTVDEFIERAQAYLGLRAIDELGVNWRRWEV